MKHFQRTSQLSKLNNKTRNLAITALALMVTFMAAVPSASAAVTVASLNGVWGATLIGDSPSCGFGDKALAFTLSDGVSTSGIWSANTYSCGPFYVPMTLTITSLNPDGSGTLQINNGGGIFTYNFQVNTAGNALTMVDLTDAGEYQQGTALKQGTVTLASLNGSWQDHHRRRL